MWAFASPATPFWAAGPYRPSSGPNPLSYPYKPIFGPLVAALYNLL